MTEMLPKIPPFTRLSDRVWRVLGLNSSKFTLQGTNTYILGTGPRKILLDCGEGLPEYTLLLEQSLHAISPQAYISDIIISHGHMDHFGGLTSILSSPFFKHKGIRVHKYPATEASAVDGCKSHTVTTLIDTQDIGHLQHFPPDIYVYPLKDQQVFTTDGVTLKVIHTPGHTQDHCTFWLEEEKNIFTADHILGHGTSVFEDLSAYMIGLKTLLALKPIRLYPGHGEVVEHAIPKIEEYISHRDDRERQIIHFLQNQHLDCQEPSSSLSNDTKLNSQSESDHLSMTASYTPMEIVQVLYKDYPASLHLPAAHSVLLHLLKLEKDGLATWDRSLETVPSTASWKKSDLLSKKWHRL